MTVSTTQRPLAMPKPIQPLAGVCKGLFLLASGAVDKRSSKKEILVRTVAFARFRGRQNEPSCPPAKKRWLPLFPAPCPMLRCRPRPPLPLRDAKKRAIHHFCFNHGSPAASRGLVECKRISRLSHRPMAKRPNRVRLEGSEIASYAHVGRFSPT